MGRRTVVVLAIIILVGGGVWLMARTAQKEVPDEEDILDLDVVETEELASVLAKVEEVRSLSYDLVVSEPQADFTAEFRQKGGKIKMEMVVDNEKVINIIDAEKEVAYAYFPAHNIATKLTLAHTEEVLEGAVKEYAETILRYNPVVVGSETVEGKDTIVVEYFAEGEEVKMWIWKDHGLPIKIETYTDEGVSQAWIRNVDFSDIPDDMFELPAGVEVTETPFF